VLLYSVYCQYTYAIMNCTDAQASYGYLKSDGGNWPEGLKYIGAGYERRNDIYLQR